MDLPRLVNAWSPDDFQPLLAVGIQEVTWGFLRVVYSYNHRNTHFGTARMTVTSYRQAMTMNFWCVSMPDTRSGMLRLMVRWSRVPPRCVRLKEYQGMAHQMKRKE